jgi:pimeloyl-ACP methyl ester carboxylesterase
MSPRAPSSSAVRLAARVRLGVPALGGALALATGCLSLDGQIISAPALDAYELPTEVIPEENLELVSFETADGVTLWGVWARQPGGAPPLVYFHGTSNNLDTEMDRLEAYWSWGTHDVFMADYRGFGVSGGEPTFEGVFEEDGVAIARYVEDATGVPTAEQPWIALSLGAAIVTHTADEIEAGAIVLENMFPSARQEQRDGSGLDLPEGWFFRRTYDNLEAWSKSLTPALVIHGLADDFIDPEYAFDVVAAGPRPSFLWRPEGVAHDDIHTVIPDRYREVVLRYLARPTDDPLSSSATAP